MMDEHYRERHGFWHYLGLFTATLIGAFLAVSFVTDMAINRMMNPYYAMHKMDKEFRKMERDMAVPMPMREHFGGAVVRNNGVEFIRTPQGYKFIVDLKPFNGNTDNIKVETNDSVITISGESTIDKKNRETFTSFSQSYSLNDADYSRISKKKVNNKYIITVPYEE